jgi:Na+-transporting NADH:ubiquinone oxidoreductase subunit NqrB
VAGSDTSLPIITQGPLGPPSADRGTSLFAYNPNVLARAGAWLDRAAFKPASLPDDLVTGFALLPTVVAGLVLFKVPAAQILGVAVAAGCVGVIIGNWFWRRQFRRSAASPLIAAVFSVALIGAGAGLVLAAEIAVLAVVLEVLRVRYMPVIRAQAGLLAYAAIALLTRGLPFAYINPANGSPFTEPIATWYRFFSPASAPIDPIRLYVGNVPGPVFATSLLAVAVGVAWLAYARRVSLVVLVAFLAGAGLAIYTFHWNPLFQLDSGPTWFVAGLLLADRRLLPDSWSIRPVLGFAGGLFAVGLRHNGYGVEAAFFTVATVQAVMAVFVLLYWGASVAMERWKRTRRLRQREANLRVIKPAS